MVQASKDADNLAQAIDSANEIVKGQRPSAQTYSPSQVPFIDDDYTYADRQIELELLENLLALRLSQTRLKLNTIREINRTRSYPNIAFQDEQPKA